jgi:hypothetical protein
MAGRSEMTKHKNNRHDGLKTSSAGKRGISVTVIIVLTVAIVASLGLWWWKARPDTEPPAAPRPAETRTTSSPAPAERPKADFQKLKGSWLRPDGGYVIAVKSVDDNGRMEASYSNPGPIHVAKAEASRDGETVKVFVELRDVNYPGSTYDLIYDPQSDSLSGIYYQAALQQRFEVVFTRMN